MKAFLAGLAAAVLIAVVAGVALSYLPQSASDVYRSQQGNVRL